MIVPPVYAAQCVEHYSINSFNSAGSISPVGNFNAPSNNGSEESVHFRKGGFDLCLDTYNFSIAGVTSEGTGERSELFSQGPVNFRSKLR